MELNFGLDGEQVACEVRNGQSSVALMTINDVDYFICTTPLSISDWSLMLIIEESYFDGASKNAFAVILVIVAAILFVAALLAIAVFWYFNKLKINKRILAKEQEANEELNLAYKMKSNFLSYMSHDIRTPINGMIGMARIGLANLDDKKRIEDCFSKIDLSSKHLLTLVNDVLDMSAAEAGKVVITNAGMNIVNVLADCVNIINGTLANRSITLEQHYDCTDENVLGDEFHLKQIIINLLSNAVKFTEDGGRIDISCHQTKDKSEPNEYVITVSDTGCGMSEEFQTHLFEPFSTANLSGKTKYKGTGLGMSISAEYVKLMGGTIDVQSKLNEGTTFTITLPFERDVKIKKQANPKELNVLLVEDNEINTEIALEMLKDNVKSVTVAKNGKEAVEKFTASPINGFNLILMDIQMPEMNGHEATKAIRSLGRSDSNVTIIALTANTYKDDIDAIVTSGMDGYLNKPFTLEQLMEIIKRGDVV